MASVTQNDLRITNAKNFVSYLNEGNSYMFIGRPTPWGADIDALQPRQTAGDNSPPYPQNNSKDYYSVWNQMLGMNKIDINEIHHMISKIEWKGGVVYDMYHHDYKEYNRSHSNAKNLYNARFYVLSQNNNVYACLDNNYIAPSTVAPLAESDEPFYTSDGYQWLRLYQIDSTLMLTSSTNNFIPITSDKVNQVEFGQVHTVFIDSRGDDYTSMPSGVNNNISYYYCNINGDGTGAVARVQVEGGKVSEVRVIRHGEGYTYATLDFAPNRVYESLTDLDNRENGLNPLGDGTFRTTVIVGPPGGWGSDLVRQLGATRVAVYSNFVSTNNDYVSKSEFRQVGIMSGMDIVANNTPESIGMIYAVKVEELTGSINIDYKMYETIYQKYTDDDDPRIEYVAYGQVVGWDDDNGIIRYIQDPKMHADEFGKMYEFKGEGPIVGYSSGKETIPMLSYSNVVDGLTINDGYALPEAVKFTGMLDYVTNITPVKRAPNQSERVSLIISY